LPKRRGIRDAGSDGEIRPSFQAERILLLKERIDELSEAALESRTLGRTGCRSREAMGRQWKAHEHQRHLVAEDTNGGLVRGVEAPAKWTFKVGEL
jgi:hypothetical protein